MDPLKLLSVDAKGNYNSMMDDIDRVSDDDKRRVADACLEMDEVPAQGPGRAPGRLRELKKKVGERIKVHQPQLQGHRPRV